MNDYAGIEAFAARFYPGYDLLLTPFAYRASFGSQAAGVELSQQINIEASGDFIMLGIRWRSFLGTTVGQTIGTLPVPFLRLLLTDSGSGEKLSQQPIDLMSYGRLSDQDIPLSYPRILSGRTSLTAQLSNYAPAAETVGGTDVTLYGVTARAYSRGQGGRGAIITKTLEQLQAEAGLL